MSLTETNEVVAIAHEDGLNDLLQAFFTARPRHRIYGTNAFIPSTTVNATNIPPIAFPGISGGIQFAIVIDIPKIDLNPDTLGGPLPPGLGQFTISTKVLLAVLCGIHRTNDFTHLREPSQTEFKSTALELFARGEIINSGDNISFRVDDIEIVDIAPDDLESVLECILKNILQTVLSTVRIPFNTLSAGAFTLTFTEGPRIETNQVKIFGNL